MFDFCLYDGKNTIKLLITDGKFEDARREISLLDYGFAEKILVDIAWELEDEKVPLFVLFMAGKETNTEKKSYWYNLLSEIFTIVIPYLPNSYKKGVFYLRKAIRINPSNVKFKEYFVETYLHPDGKEYISDKEVLKIAREILKVDSLNKKAKLVIKKIKKT